MDQQAAMTDNTELVKRLEEAFAKISAQERVIVELREAVFNNLPYLENLILPHGHESALLRKHPLPCGFHDFCFMRQAQEGADTIRAALSKGSGQ